jgi:hypothetical protein
MGQAIPVSPAMGEILNPQERQSVAQRGQLALGLGLLGHGGQAGMSAGQHVAQAVQGAQQQQSGAINEILAARDFAMKQRSAALQNETAQFGLDQARAGVEKQKQDALRAEEIMARRMQGVNPNDPRAVAHALNAALPELMGAGLTEPYRALSGYLAANNALLNSPKTQPRDIRVEGDVQGEDGKTYKVFYDNDTGEEVRRVPQAKNTSSSEGRLIERARAQDINSILDDYQMETKKTTQLANRMRAVGKRSIPDGDAAGQFEVLLTFISMIDETAAREGEQAAVRAGGPPLENARGIYNKYLKGEPYLIGPTMVKQMQNAINSRLGVYDDVVKGAKNRAFRRASILGVGDDVRYIMEQQTPDTSVGAGAPPEQPTTQAPTLRRFMK